MKYLIVFLIICTSPLILAQTGQELYELAADQSENENYKKALKTINNAIDKDSTDVKFFRLKLQLLESLEQYQECSDYLSIVVKKFPKDPLLHHFRGAFLTTIQEFNSAIMSYNRALKYAEIDSVKFLIIANRATPKIRIRQFESAYDDLMMAYAFDSTEIAVLVNLSVVCDEVGKGDQTLMYLNKALEQDSTFWPIYANIGYKHQEMGQHEKAIEYYNIVLKNDPNEALGYSNRAFNYYKTGEIKKALKDIDKSIKLYPENSYAYKVRALIYLEMKENKKACEDIQTALDRGYTTSYGDEVKKLKIEYCK